MRPMRPAPITPIRTALVVVAAITSSLSETTCSQRPVCTDFSSAACTLTHSTASVNPGENGRSSAIARQNS